MRLVCSNCQRTFELDETRLRLEQISSLRCVCHERLDFGPQGAGQKLRLGKYILVNRIAVGGMGEIYYGKVSGVEGFEKEVAIKRMLSHLSADRNFVDMMVKEAKLTVLLNHPNIVGIYDLARQGDEYYIAMEYVPGVTVGTILEQARKDKIMLPVDVAMHITMQVLRGLHYAHNLAGPTGERVTILHRDITPQNILVTRGAFVKITDFGIAKAVNEISTTSTGMIKGKVGYIAPEQLEGKEPDQRIDLFCAAILLWEMLMVRRLFKGTSEVDTFRLISECKIPPVSAQRDDINPAVEEVLFRALSRNPDQRYLQADEFNAALAQAILPRTADDLARSTAAFFAEHPDYFASVVAHKGQPDGAAPPDAATGTQTPTDKLPLVSQYIQPPLTSATMATAPAGSRFIWPAVATLALLVVGGVFYGRVVAPSAQQAAQSMVSNVVVPPPAAVPPSPAAPAAAPAPAEAAHPAAVPSAAPAAPAGKKDGKLATPGTAEAGATGERHAGHDEVRPAPRRAPRPAPARPLTSPEIQTTVRRYQSDIARCLRDIDMSTAPAAVEAQITIDMSGAVSAVHIEPEIGQIAIDKCLAKSLKSMRFHRHPGPELKVTIPLKLQVM